MKWLDSVGTMVVTRLDFRDVLLPGSLVALLFGLSQWSRPLAWVIGGLVGLGLWSLPHWRRKA